MLVIENISQLQAENRKEGVRRGNAEVGEGMRAWERGAGVGEVLQGWERKS